MKIVLASGSPRRQQLLRQVVPEFEVMPPKLNEKTIRRSDPAELVLALALAKAEEVSGQLETPTLVIASDVVIVFNNEIREKAADLNQARQYLQSYSGNKLEVYTGLVVCHTESRTQRQHVEKSLVYLKDIPEQAIEQILKEEHVLDWAGSFAIQDATTSFYVEKIEGNLNAIIGLPTRKVKKFISEFLHDQRQ